MLISCLKVEFILQIEQKTNKRQPSTWNKMEQEHEEFLKIQELQLCTHAMPGTLSIDALKSLALLRYQMHTPVGAAHLAFN